MKLHHILAIGVAFGLAPTAARADKPASPPGKPTDAKPDEHRHGKPGDEAKDGKGDKGEKLGKGDASDKGGHGKPGDKTDEPGSKGKPDGANPGDFKRAWRELHAELKSGKLKKDELKAKLAKLQDTSAERAQEHRRELGERWGRALTSPAVHEELKHHARRVAFLNRALVLAQSEEKDQAKRTERITKLLDKENERHERAMERFKGSAAPAASGLGASVAASAAATPPAASAEGSKGGTP
jgi:hypothetical protein